MFCISSFILFDLIGKKPCAELHESNSRCIPTYKAVISYFTEACPSFAEIGMALENLLLENQPDYTESTSLSVEYQYMLSYCWNNIKVTKNTHRRSHY